MAEKIHKNAKVLIVTWSPIPTPKYQKIEGSGQRAYGLATGLQKNGVSDITIAIGHIYPLDVKQVNGIKLFNYDFDSKFAERLAGFDTIIYNYAIHGSVFISSHLPKNAQVIIDAYGPAYIESLARDPEDMVGTYVGNLSAVNDVFNKVLPRGDFFLFANDAQEKFYTGVLATLGIINQFSYKTDRLISTPFGIDVPDSTIKYDNPYTEFGFKATDFTLLWFGGLYPWFDITKILDTIHEDKTGRIKLVIVGGNNPQNQHPDFVKHYQSVVNYIQSNGLENKIILIDWVDFATRRKYYEHADAIISMNGDGKENSYSWRTRVMDYVGSTTPLITNGGDPLSDELIASGAAIEVDIKSSSDIHDTLLKLASDKKLLSDASKKMKLVQPKYYWQNVTKVLADKIINQEKPFTEERLFKLEHGISGLSVPSNSANHSTVSKLLRAPNKAKNVLKKVKEKGVKTTYIVVKDKVKRRVIRELSNKGLMAVSRSPKIIVVANQLNNTGAPFVIMDVIGQLKSEYPYLAMRVKLVTFTPVEVANIRKLEELGIDVEVYTNRDLHLDFVAGDIVVFNTFAISRLTVTSTLKAIQDKKIKKLYWYGHEATPSGFIEQDIKGAIKKLLLTNKAKVYGVSSKSVSDYADFFGTKKNVDRMPFRFLFPEEKFKVQHDDDFSTLNFVTTGSLMDMRKGQYPILYAFLDFYHNYFVKNPSHYREFTVNFLGAYDKTDVSSFAAYHVKNIKKQFELSASALGDRVIVSQAMSHEKAIDIIEQSNVTICYSLYEALPIFVYEGMAAGHPIIRNESSGREEQLVDGKNGYAVSNEDFAGLVDTIEAVLNKKTTTNASLSDMSKQSNAIALLATKNTYPIIEDIHNIAG